jgi:hypothetical protein
MDADASRPLAQLVAWGRIGIGISAVVAPSRAARPWIGVDAGAPGSRLLARAMGGRDLALGIGALRGLGLSDREARPWVALGGMADAVDALATVLAFGSLPRRSLPRRPTPPRPGRPGEAGVQGPPLLSAIPTGGGP